jgi:hypothetical protein
MFRLFRPLAAAGAAGQKPQHLAYMSRFLWHCRHEHPRQSWVTLANNRSTTAYPARARLAEVPLRSRTSRHRGGRYPWRNRWSTPISEQRVDGLRNAQFSAPPKARRTSGGRFHPDHCR